MKRIKIILTGLLCLFLANLSLGQVITAEQFMKMYKSDKNLKVIDAGKSGEYGAYHIKNAISIPHATLYKDGPVPALIQSPEKLAQIFGNKGVSNTNAIVVYDEGSEKYSSRVYWILKYLGVENVWILHKNMSQWRKVRIPVTSAVARVTKTQFSPKVNQAVFAIPQDQLAPKDVIVDCRTRNEYLGLTANSKGHIPGAVNIDYTSLLNGDGSFKSVADILKIMEMHGVSKDENITLYCQTSIRATVVFAALNGILKWPNVKVYDGAYVGWVHNGKPLSTKYIPKHLISQR